MKARWFLAGVRFSSWVAGSLPFAFLAGFYTGLGGYASSMIKRFEQEDAQLEWKRKADNAYKPEVKNA